MDAVAIGRRVRDLRKKLKMSKAALATKAGVHRNTVLNVERGQHAAGHGTLEALASALDTTPQELIFGRKKAS